MPPSRALWRLVGGSTLAIAVACGGLASGTACGTSYGAASDPDALPDRTGGDGGADAPLEEAAPPACDLAKIATDPENCGRCGHSCLGGKCLASACQPVVAGSSAGETVVDVAIDATRVIWLTATTPWAGPGHVYACPRAGCGAAAPTSLTGGQVTTGNLAADGTTAFFSQTFGAGALFQIEPSGVLQPIAKPHAAALRLQVLDGLVYFTTLFESMVAGTYAGTVYRWNTNTATEDVVGHFDGPQNYLDVIATGTRLFLRSYTVIATCIIGQCTSQQTFFTAPASVNLLSLATDGASLFWTDETSVFSCSASAATCPTPTALLGPAQLGGATAVSVTYSSGDLYVATAGNDLFTCRMPDCAATVRKVAHETRLFRGTEFTEGRTVAADDEAIYWSAVDVAPSSADAGADASGDSYRIMKVAK